jgi:hypothetical protein
VGVVTVTVAVVVVVEPLDPPQAVVANTAERMTTLSHPSECSRPMAGDCTGLQDLPAKPVVERGVPITEIAAHVGHDCGDPS